jgi:hypothetical protein
MFELMMTYCLVGQPCAVESVANFPQYDVGRSICELAKPGVELGVRERAPRGTRITFECKQPVREVEYEYQTPSRERSPDLLEQVLPRVMQEAGRYLR